MFSRGKYQPTIKPPLMGEIRGIESMTNNKGMTLIEAIILIICIAIIALWLYTMSKYGNKPVSEMPIWLYWLLH